MVGDEFIDAVVCEAVGVFRFDEEFNITNKEVRRNSFFLFFFFSTFISLLNLNRDLPVYGGIFGKLFGSRGLGIITKY